MFQSKKVNISVEDIDDNGPVFTNSDRSKCALPVYTAGAAEQFVVSILNYQGPC